MQPLKLTLTWRRIKTEDSDEPQKTNNRHNPKSGSSRLVRTKKKNKKKQGAIIPCQRTAAQNTAGVHVRDEQKMEI